MADNNENQSLVPEEPGEGAAAQAETDNIENEKTKRIDLREALAEAGEADKQGEAEEPAEEAAQEAEPAAEGGEGYSAAEGTDAQLLSEFAPKPMNIPNVDLDKEKKKQEKRRKNHGKEVKKVQARKKKNGKKKGVGQKILVTVVGFVLFVMLTGLLSVFISVLSVQTATSSYAFKVAVRNMDIPNISIGGIANYEDLGIKKSPSNAALVDIIRDNSDVSVTYREICASIRGSGVNDFIAKRLKAASDYLLKGKSYSDLTGEEIAAVIRDSSTLVQNLTGRVLGVEDYAAIAEYFEEYGNLENVSRQALDNTMLAKHTDVTRHLMSLGILGALLLICIVLIILACIVCREYSYLPLGWSFILGGLIVVVTAIFKRPSYTVGAEFLKSVLSSYFNFFTATVIIIAGIFTVVGAIIFLIGNASADRE